MSGSASNFKLDFNETEVTQGGAHSNPSAPSSGGGGGGSGTVTNVATGTGLTGGPITTSGTIAIAATAVTPGSYTNANITVNAEGQLTAAANGSSGGGGTVTSVGSGTGLTGGPITGSGTLSIASVISPTGPIGDSTHVAQVTVNAEGQVTALSAVLITGSGGAPSGPAGGDLSGTYPNPVVAQIQTIPVSDVGGAVAFVNPAGAAEPAIQAGSSLPLYLMGNWPGWGMNAFNNGSIWVFGAGSSTSGNGDFGGYFQLRMNQAVANGALMYNVSTAAGTAGAQLHFQTALIVYPNGHQVLGLGAVDGNPLADDGTNMLQVNGNARISSLTNGIVVGDASGNLTTTTLTGGLPVGGTIYQTLKKNSATNYDAGWYGPDWFNAKDYGTIQLAVTACCAAGGGGVFIPSGTWSISAAITLSSGFTGQLSIRGAGRFATTIVATTASQNGFTLDLSAGTQQSVVSVEDIGFQVESGIVAGTAIYIKQVLSASSENQGGCVVRGINIWSNSSSTTPGNTDGWTNGINLVNCWHSRTEDVYGYGNATNSASGSPIGSGSGGAGSGAFLQFASGTSNAFINCHCDFWGIGLHINYVASTTTPQGTIVTGCNFVATVRNIVVDGASGAGIDGLLIANCQFDGGGHSISACSLLEVMYGGNITYAGVLGICDTGVAFQFTHCSNIMFSSCLLGGTSTAGNFATAVSVAGWSAGDDVQLQGPISLDSATTLCSLSNITAQTVTDSGTGNFVGRNYTLDAIVALTSTATQNFNINISGARLGKAAGNVIAQVIGPLGTTKVTAVYDAASGSNTATNAVMTAYCFDLSSPGAGNYQFLFQIIP